MRNAIALALILNLTAAPIFAAAKTTDVQYDKGVKAIDKQKWDTAITIFRGLVEGNEQPDRALYWLAYAQKRAGHQADALASIQRLRRSHPKSPWLDDASALEVEIRQASGQQVSPDSLADDDLKLLALNGIMNSDPERAITLLEKMLRGSTAEETKEGALFVLAQSSAPRASQLLESVARGNFGLSLQEHALQMLGTTPTEKNRTLLASIYRSSTNEETKTAAMHGLMIAGDRALILDIARNDKDAGMRGEAAILLGTMKGLKELDSLYASETSVAVKEEIIQGMFIAGNAERIGQLARSEKNPELRAEAIRALGTFNAAKTGAILQGLWSTESDEDAKEAIIEALFIQGNASALVAMAKRETDRSTKRSIVEKLALMKNPEARDYMRSLLE
jgi:tetratricopeptide (TPR) repeat protein